jgi:hypothetical protein
MGLRKLPQLDARARLAGVALRIAESLPSDIAWARQSDTNAVNAVAGTEAAGTRLTCSGQSANLIPDSP